MTQGKAGAPRNNQNRAGKATKEKKRIQISLSISDCTDIGDGLIMNLRDRFEEYLLYKGINPSDEEIKRVARQWAYEAWWSRLKRAEDEQAIMIL